MTSLSRLPQAADPETEIGFVRPVEHRGHGHASIDRSHNIIMPTIKARKQASGETRYTAIVRIRRGGSVIHREAKTFTHPTAAVS